MEVVYSEIVFVSEPRPATLLGKGKVEGLDLVIKDQHADLAIIDSSLTPVQQRNLEKAWGVKVIDRTALILEIFGERARTKEGVLQVELAHLTYQKGRLVRSWTHLERQRSGGSFLGGPGETQIEADRRILEEKILRIKRELKTVVKTRYLHRAKRKKVPHPVVALVGYTNAGKSTLFNALSGASVLAKDMLFATLDPTLRKIILPHGQTVILSDTVGFISNLPTHLIAAFRATLEEVVEADLIIHVRDMADSDHVAHAQDVTAILSRLGITVDDPTRLIEVWNKVDLLDQETLAMLERSAALITPSPTLMSATKDTDLKPLLQAIEERLSGKISTLKIKLTPHEMPLLNWLYKNSAILSQKSDEEGNIYLCVEITKVGKDQFQYLYNQKI